MRTIVVTVFCVCTSISAAAQITSPTLQARPAPPVKPAGPTIKGHALGESIAEFLAVAGQPDLVSQCRSLVASSPAPSKKKGGGALNSVFGVGDAGRQFTRMQEADKERQDRTARDGCSVLISGVDTGARIEKLLDEGTFEGARLVRFDVRIGQDVMGLRESAQRSQARGRHRGRSDRCNDRDPRGTAPRNRTGNESSESDRLVFKTLQTARAALLEFPAVRAVNTEPGGRGRYSAKSDDSNSSALLPSLTCCSGPSRRSRPRRSRLRSREPSRRASRDAKMFRP
jgi:hypothetical protein